MIKKDGITLISLVITIVVLLILAGISVDTLLGENGVINNIKK
jgi:Tfp pilus assembly protein PilE